jgi:DNA modification methylase
VSERVVIGQAELLTGDCLAVLSNLPDASVQCCVTSPPYFGLRSYDETAVRINPALPDDKLAWLLAELERRCVYARS